MKQIVQRSVCPISLTLEDIGDRWSLLIIRDLLFAGKRTYKELLASPEGIATNILADRLKQLENNGLVQKLPHPTSKRQNEYVLTKKGSDLLPVLAELIAWGMKYKAAADYPREFVDPIIAAARSSR